MPSLNYFPDGEAIREFFEPAVKSPSIPLCKRGMTTDSPLWPLARRASDPEGKGELEGIFLKLWLNWGNTFRKACKMDSYRVAKKQSLPPVDLSP